jgi:CBS domain-containing protein
MAFHNVGAILVMENNRELVGIFTERDALRRVMLQGLDPRTTPIRDVMTPDVIIVSADTPRGDVHQIMRQKHIRHIPVADGDRLLGVVSLRDVLAVDNLDKSFEIDNLRAYIMERPYPTYPG